VPLTKSRDSFEGWVVCDDIGPIRKEVLGRLRGNLLPATMRLVDIGLAAAFEPAAACLKLAGSERQAGLQVGERGVNAVDHIGAMFLCRPVLPWRRGGHDDADDSAGEVPHSEVAGVPA
jgi:hypothetical protein